MRALWDSLEEGVKGPSLQSFVYSVRGTSASHKRSSPDCFVI